MSQFDGLPLHPLVVHAPVVLIPLVAGGLVLLLARPPLRRPLAPFVALLAVAAAGSSLGAVWSGEELGEALGRGDELDHHETWGELTRLLAVAVAVGATAYALLVRFPPARQRTSGAVGIVTAGLAVAAVAVVGVTGHAGAKLAWEGRVAGDDVARPQGPLATAAAAEVSPVPPSSATGSVPQAAATAAPTAAPAPAPAPAPPGTGTPGVDVVLGEWALVPSAREVPPGTVTFRFRNLGTVPHALRIRTTGSGGDRREWRSEVVEPGGSGLLVADLAAGSYEVDCPVEDAAGEHDALGMEMLLTVDEGAARLEPLPGGDQPQQQPDPPAPSASAEGSATVGISGFAFTPPTVQVPVGAQVLWTNQDPAVHTATGEGFDTGRLPQGATAAVTFDTPGVYDYRCSLHPAMRARVRVGP